MIAGVDEEYEEERQLAGESHEEKKIKKPLESTNFKE